MWLKLEAHETEPTVTIDASTTNDGLTLAQSEALQVAIAQLRVWAAEPAWCVIARDYPLDPHEVHASETVKLSHYTENEAGSHVAGWHGWLTQGRGGPITLHLEGATGEDEEEDFATELGIADVSYVLAATNSAPAHNALLALLEQATS